MGMGRDFCTPGKPVPQLWVYGFDPNSNSARNGIKHCQLISVTTRNLISATSDDIYDGGEPLVVQLKKPITTVKKPRLSLDVNSKEMQDEPAIAVAGPSKPKRPEQIVSLRD